MIPLAGPPGSLALMNAPDALPGYEALLPPDTTFRNEVAARVAPTITAYRPGRAAKKINFPILFCVSNTDSVTPPAQTLRYARTAPRGRSNATTPAISPSTSASPSKHWYATRSSFSPANCSRRSCSVMSDQADTRVFRSSDRRRISTQWSSGVGHRDGRHPQERRRQDGQGPLRAAHLKGTSV